MMDEKRTVFSYIFQMFAIFGFNMLCLTGFTYLVGDSAKQISQMYSLGSEGIALRTSFEFFLVSVIVVLLQYVIFSDRWIKEMAFVKRIFCMIAGVLALISLFVYFCGWFPINMWQPWVMFLFCFFICFGASVVISAAKAKAENEKLMKGLEKMKKQWEEEYGEDR